MMDPGIDVTTAGQADSGCRPRYPVSLELHVFNDCYDPDAGLNFVLDVTSSRLLALDNDAVDALASLQRHDRRDTIHILQAGGMPASRAVAAVQAIDDLILEGKLVPCSPETRAQLPQSFSVGFMNLNLAHACDLRCIVNAGVKLPQIAG